MRGHQAGGARVHRAGQVGAGGVGELQELLARELERGHAHREVVVLRVARALLLLLLLLLLRARACAQGRASGSASSVLVLVLRGL